MSHLAKLQTLARLGPQSIARVAAYRLGLRSGLHPVLKVHSPVAQGPFFRPSERSAPSATPNTTWDDTLWRFGLHRTELPSGPPDWFANPFSDLPQPDASRDWWKIPDFGAGDIKGLWELSRFDWIVAWATKAAAGDAAALTRLNAWLSDWAQANPPYKGPNWKCGQEVSIRVMHLVLASWILGQDRTPENGLVALVVAHLKRIAPTMSYAIGQQNNHGTSEAAALFIGGNFLAGLDARASGWARAGRRWLEERAATLIEPDGSFSQYSVTYHRVMLDTYALSEAWRCHRDLPAFSGMLTSRLSAATRWLEAMTDPETGDAPNIGANDGARLIPLSDSGYRDFRPSVQLAAALFDSRDAFGQGSWNRPLQWLNASTGAPGPSMKSTSFDEGGYHVLRGERAMAVLRYPRFRFRPSQADALHLDLFAKSQNLLRDAGTYSYNAPLSEWFSGTSAHNTVEFDGRDQMPRLGRFLFGDWLRAESVRTVSETDSEISAAAGYRDRKGARHFRVVTIKNGQLICEDTIDGRFKAACLRWRLIPDAYALDGLTLTGTHVSLSIDVAGASPKARLVSAPESRYYQQKAEIPVLELTVDKPSTVVTRVSF